MDPIRTQAVIMAGGFGSRLRPLTDQVPKPMLPIGDRPLLERTLEALLAAGIKKVHIATHYKAEMIQRHFGSGESFGVEVRYLNEAFPMGTAGALSLLGPTEGTILVINGDILSHIDYRAFVAYHRERRAELTVATLPHSVEIPYGVVACEGSRVVGVREKPRIDFLISAGIYCLESHLLAQVPRGECFDMPNLLSRTVERGHTVVNYPLVDYWADIGSQADYAKAQAELGGNA